MPILSTPLTELLSATARPSIASSPAALSALLRRIDSSPEPATVFKSVTRVVVPLLCDASSVWLSTAGQRPSHTTFRLADSAGYPAGPEEVGSHGRDSVADADALVGEDTVAIPINPPFAAEQAPYRGILTMSFHGSQPPMTHVLIGHLLVERAIALVQREQLAAKVDNLSRALDSNREIGAAMGILMVRHQLTSRQAFDLLRRTSQRSHRKIAAIAPEVVEAGMLELPDDLELLEARPTPGPSRRHERMRMAH